MDQTLEAFVMSEIGYKYHNLTPLSEDRFLVLMTLFHRMGTDAQSFLLESLVWHAQIVDNAENHTEALSLSWAQEVCKAVGNRRGTNMQIIKLIWLQHQLGYCPKALLLLCELLERRVGTCWF